MQRSRNATFKLFRARSRNPMGISYTYDVAILHLEMLANGQQVRTVREYSLGLPNLTASGTGESLKDAVNKLKRLFKKH